MGTMGDNNPFNGEWKSRVQRYREARRAPAEMADPRELLRRAGAAPDPQERALALKILIDDTPEFQQVVRGICARAFARWGNPDSKRIPTVDDLVQVVSHQFYQAVTREPKRFGDKLDPYPGCKQYLRAIAHNLLTSELPHNHYIECQKAGIALAQIIPLLRQAETAAAAGEILEWLGSLETTPAELAELLRRMLSDSVPNPPLSWTAGELDRSRRMLRLTVREYERRRKETR